MACARNDLDLFERVIGRAEADGNTKELMQTEIRNATWVEIAVMHESDDVLSRLLAHPDTDLQTVTPIGRHN